MISWAGGVCFFLAAVMSRLFFSSFHRLLADIYSHPLDVSLAFKPLSFTRPSELSTLDQPIVNWLYSTANGSLADRIGWGRVLLSSISLQDINLISRWRLQLSLAGLPLLVGENRVGNICRKTLTLTAVSRLKSDSDRPLICCDLIL